MHVIIVTKGNKPQMVKSVLKEDVTKELIIQASRLNEKPLHNYVMDALVENWESQFGAYHLCALEVPPCTQV